MLNKQISLLVSYAIENKFTNLNLIKKNIKKITNLLKEKITYENQVEEKINYQSTWKNIDILLNKKFKINNLLELDILKDELVSLIIGDPQWINNIFFSFNNSCKAMLWFEDFCKFTTYIKTERIKKNITFSFENLIITLNKSKPEKTIEQIKAQAKNKSKLSVLDKNQVGKKGSLTQAPRMAHRIIYLSLNKEKWFIQYSPYQYFDKHSILISEKVKPMLVNEKAIETMIDFVDYLPSFNISLNADIPIVGGSILKHMHFQCGEFTFPIYKAQTKKLFESVYKVDWPITTLLIKSQDKNVVIQKGKKIIEKWKKFKDSKFPNILGENNNSCSLTLYKKNNEYNLFILLRNNSTSQGNKDGIFHVPKHLQAIKKENIGIIEAVGLAIFPGRLDWKLVNLNGQEYKLWKKYQGVPKNEKEYYYLIGKTFKEILQNCDPFRILNNFDMFIKSIKGEKDV